jgi:hypothetical protein
MPALIQVVLDVVAKAAAPKKLSAVRFNQLPPAYGL